MDLTTGCLDEPCDIVGVGASVLAACLEVTGGADDTSASWVDRRDPSGQDPTGIEMRCGADSLTPEECPGVCATLGLRNPLFHTGNWECWCSGELPVDGELAGQMVELACESGPGNVYVGLSTLFGGVFDLKYSMAVECLESTTRKGGCVALRDLVHAELGLELVDLSDTGERCSSVVY